MTAPSSTMPRSIPYSRATNTVPVIRAIGDPNLNSEIAMGRVTPVTRSGSPSVSLVASNRAGRVASDDRVLKATACAPPHARANARRVMPPNETVMGYSAATPTLTSTDTTTR